MSKVIINSYEEFEKMIAKEELIEYARYVDNYYAVSYTHLTLPTKLEV